MASSFNIEFSTSINAQGLMAGVQGLIEQISKTPPLTIGAEVKPVSVGNAQQVLESVAAQATSLDTVIVKQETWKNKLGETVKGISQLAVTYKDANGNMRTVTENVTSAVTGLGAGWKKVTTELVKNPIGKQISDFEKYYSKQDATFQKMLKSANEWNIRAEKMNAKEKQQIQDSVVLLKQKYEAYRMAVSTGNVVDANELAEAVRSQNLIVEENIAKSKRAAGAVRNWADNIKNAVVQTVSYTFSLGTLRAAQQLLNNAIEFTIDLNKEMVKIQLLQVEGAKTDAEIKSLASSYNVLAKELGATTIEVAQGSVEWLRQGKTIQETQELLRSSTMLSKLGNIEAAESTELLTSAVNGYGMASEEAMGIVDKLIAVDNVAATSAKELAVALRYSSAVASQAGVSLEQLISYIGVISSTTRQNAEMIGQALKTIFTRMQDIKQGGLDEDGLGINNVERALRRVDVKLRDSQTEFRNMSDVLEDIAAKWNTLNEVEQANIAKAVAGVRQQNMFMILMTNMNKAIELQEVQYNSAGLAVDRYGIYLNSVEASQNRLKTSFQNLFLTFGEMDKVLITINNLASGVIDLVADMGGLKTILAITLTALVAFNMATIKTTVLTKLAAITSSGMGAALKELVTVLFASQLRVMDLASALKEVKVAFQAMSVGTIVGLVATLAVAFVSLASTIDEPIERLEKLREKTQAIQDQITGLRTKASDIASLTAEYDSLKEELGDAANENQRFLDIQNRLRELIPELAGHYDAYGNFIVDTTADMRELNNETLAQIEHLKELLRLQIEGTAKRSGANIGQMFLELNQDRAGGVGLKKNPEQKAEEIKEWTDAIAKEKGNFLAMGKEAQEEYIKGFTETLWFKPELKEALTNLFRGLQNEEAVNAWAGRLTAEAEAYFKEHPVEAAALQISEEGLFSFAKELKNKIEKFIDIQGKLELGDFATISTDDLAALGFMEEDVVAVGDKFKLSEDAVKAFNEEIENQILALEKVNPEMATMIRSLMEGANGVDELTQSFMDNQSMLEGIQSELEDTGQLGYESIMKMVDAGYAEALSIDAVTGKITVKTEVLRSMVLAEAAAAWAAATHAVEQAKEDGATRAVTASLLAKEAALKGVYLAILKGGGFTVPSVKTSGGGGGKNPEVEAKKQEIEAIKEKIDALEDEKKALEKRKDEFAEYIELQKESLRLAKEEDDFNKKLAQKNKDLADIKTEIALLALDDSEEARARRLELEKEAGDLETEISEDVEDRKYDVQMDALDKAKDAFDKAIDNQIEGINKVIDSYKDQIDAINKVIDKLGGSGGGGGGGGTLKSESESTYEALKKQILAATDLTDGQKQGILAVIRELKNQGKSVEELIAKYEYLRTLMLNNPGFGTTINTGTGGTINCFVAGTKISISKNEYINIEDVGVGSIVLSYDLDKGVFVNSIIESVFKREAKETYVLNNSIRVTGEHKFYVNNKWLPVKEISVGDYFYSINNEYVKVTSTEKIYENVAVYNIHTSKEPHNYFANNVLVHNKQAAEWHEGGAVETHHGGDFAGSLKTNEVFAKLIKGEFVSTEGQMNNFLRNVLPKLVMGKTIETRKISSSENTDINVDIIIQGNVDKSVIPDMKEAVTKGINEALKQRGIRRSAGSFSI